jgi:hypothetical protein
MLDMNRNDSFLIMFILPVISHTVHFLFSFLFVIINSCFFRVNSDFITFLYFKSNDFFSQKNLLLGSYYVKSLTSMLLKISLNVVCFTTKGNTFALIKSNTSNHNCFVFNKSILDKNHY